jgi:hypothetical protein
MLNSYGNILEYFIDSEELDKAILCE